MPSFYVSAYIKSNHGEDDFLMIGEKYDHTEKSVTGDAKFFVDLKTVPTPSAAVDIAAAIYLPKLYSYGYVTMVVNDTMATFEGAHSMLNNSETVRVSKLKACLHSMFNNR